MFLRKFRKTMEESSSPNHSSEQALPSHPCHRDTKSGLDALWAAWPLSECCEGFQSDTAGAMGQPAV